MGGTASDVMSYDVIAARVLNFRDGKQAILDRYCRYPHEDDRRSALSASYHSIAKMDHNIITQHLVLCRKSKDLFGAVGNER